MFLTARDLLFKLLWRGTARGAPGAHGAAALGTRLIFGGVTYV